MTHSAVDLAAPRLLGLSDSKNVARKSHLGPIGFTVSEFAQESIQELRMGCEFRLRSRRAAPPERNCLKLLVFYRIATRVSNLAGRQGFEPRYHGPERAQTSSVILGVVGFVRKLSRGDPAVLLESADRPRSRALVVSPLNYVRRVVERSDCMTITSK